MLESSRYTTVLVALCLTLCLCTTIVAQRTTLRFSGCGGLGHAVKQAGDLDVLVGGDLDLHPRNDAAHESPQIDFVVDVGADGVADLTLAHAEEELGNADAWQQISLDLPPHVGQSAVIRIVDRRGGGHGWLGVDAIQVNGQPISGLNGDFEKFAQGWTLEWTKNISGSAPFFSHPALKAKHGERALWTFTDEYGEDDGLIIRSREFVIPPPGEIAKVVDDPPAVTVVYQPSAHPLVAEVAGDFSKFARVLSGKQVAVVASDDVTGRGDVVIVLDVAGKHPLIQRAERRGSAQVTQLLPREPDGFVILGFERSGPDTLIISGSSKTGLTYGAYHYLSHLCHVGIFRDGWRAPRGTGLPVAGIHIVEEPAFPFRALGWRTHSEYNWYRYLKQDFQVPGEPDYNLGFSAGRPFPSPFFDAREAADHYNPKICMITGITDVRGLSQYFPLVIDDPEDYTASVRYVASRAGDQESQKSSNHLYSVPFPCENWEYQHTMVPNQIAYFDWLKTVDPRATLVVDSYQGGNLEPLMRTGKVALYFLDRGGNSFGVLPPGRRVAGLYHIYNDWYGNHWSFGGPFMCQNTSQYQSLGYRQWKIMADEVLRQPDQRCTGFWAFSDSSVNTLFEDWFAQLNWDSREVTLEQWIQDYALRRYGERHRESMARSLAEWVKVCDAKRLSFGYNDYLSDSYHSYKEIPYWDRYAVFWYGWIDGQRDYLRMLNALMFALEEADSLGGNTLYDNWLEDLFRYTIMNGYPLSAIQMLSHYFEATRSFAEGDSSAAAPRRAAFEEAAKRTELMLATLDRVMSVQSKNIGPLPRTTTGRYASYHEPNDTMQVIHYTYRPVLSRFIDVLRKRMDQRDPRLLISRSQSIWPSGNVFSQNPSVTPEMVESMEDNWTSNETPHGDPYPHQNRFLPEVFQEAIRHAIRDDPEVPRYRAGLVEAVREGLRELHDAGCFYFDGMDTNAQIRHNFPLSRPDVYADNYTPVVESRGGEGPWSQRHWRVTPFWRWDQVIYHGPMAGHWVPQQDGRFELSFEYRNASVGYSTRRCEVEIVLYLDSDPRASWKFTHNGRRVPLVSVDEAEPVGDSFNDQIVESRYLGIRPAPVSERGPDAIDAVHRVHATWEGGKLTVGGDELPTLEANTPAYYSRAALAIRSYYPNTGTRPEVWLKNIQINGKSIQLYTDSWHEPATEQQVGALRAQLHSHVERAGLDVRKSR